MLAHNNDPDEAARIADDEAFFSDKGPDWCGYMAGLAHVIPPAIAVFMKALPGIDSRHRRTSRRYLPAHSSRSNAAGRPMSRP
jgi:hypothetical protein